MFLVFLCTIRIWLIRLRSWNIKILPLPGRMSTIIYSCLSFFPFLYFSLLFYWLYHYANEELLGFPFKTSWVMQSRVSDVCSRFCNIFSEKHFSFNSFNSSKCTCILFFLISFVLLLLKHVTVAFEKKILCKLIHSLMTVMIFRSLIFFAGGDEMNWLNFLIFLLFLSLFISYFICRQGFWLWMHHFSWKLEAILLFQSRLVFQKLVILFNSKHIKYVLETWKLIHSTRSFHLFWCLLNWIFCFQANCIDSTVPAEAVFQSEVKKLQQDQFKPLEQVTLEPFERDHACVVGGYRMPKKQKAGA